MADNLSVKIVADVADLQTKFAIAKAESGALTSELNKLARQAVQSGGNLSSDLKAQLSQAASAASAAKAQVANLNTELKAGATHFNTFGQAAGLARSALGALGIGVGLGALADLGKTIFNNAEQMQHQAEVLGMSVTAYQAFTKSAEFSGVAIEDVDRALMRFNAAQGAAQTGIGLQAKAFNDLGVSAKLPAEEALPAIARALLSITDNARRSRDEVALFGRSGEQLNPALEQWAQGLGTLSAKLEQSGNMLDPKVSEAARKAAAQMAQAFDKMETEWAPGVVKLTQALTGLAGIMDRLSHVKMADVMGSAFGLLTGNPYVPKGGSGSTPFPSESTQTGHAFIVGQNDTGAKKPPKPNFTDTADAKKAAEQARLAADAIAQAYEQGNLKHIQSEAQTNSYLLEMGQEIIAQWRAQATELEDARYQAELGYLQKKRAADAGDKVSLAKDNAEIAQLAQEHADKLVEIGQEANQKQRAVDDADIAAFAQDQEKKLQTALTIYDAEFKAGQLTAQKRHDLEVGLTAQVEQQVLARFDAEIAGLAKGTQAYADAMRQRQALVDQFNSHVTTANNQLDEEQMAQWKQLGTSIGSSLNTAIDGMVLHAKTFSQTMMQLTMSIAGDFLQMGEKIVENWAMSMIMSEVSSKTSQETQVMNAAGLAAANTMASISAIPIVGPFMAPGMAAESLAETLSFGQFAKGADMLPSDMIAQVHAGERIIPAADNSALMAAVNGRKGDSNSVVHHWNYSPTNNVTSGRRAMDEIKDNPHEFISFVQGLARGGKLKFG